MTFPPTSAHLFTQDQHERIAACRRHLETGDAWGAPLPVKLPAPPVDRAGAPIHDQPALQAFVAALEAATALNVRHAAAHGKLAKLRKLVSEASKANPVGVEYASHELSSIHRSLPARADHVTDEAWTDALEAHVAEHTKALTARVHEAYRGDQVT